MVTVTGKVFDVGMLENGRGFKIETNGEEVEVIGLTEQECREVAVCLGEKVRITIEPDNLNSTTPTVRESGDDVA